MRKPDVHLVRLIARQLGNALELRNEAEAETRIEAIMERGLRSKRRFESTFAAVQMLRDLGEVDFSEAAYLLHALFDARQWNDAPPVDPGTARLIQESPEQDELIMASIEHDDLLEIEAFYRSRGDTELADLVRKDADSYDAVVAQGHLAIFNDKIGGADEHEDEKRGTDSRHVMEALLGLASRERGKDWYPAWKRLTDALEQVTPAAAVRAVQEAYEIGAIDFDEKVRLLDMACCDPISEESASDRQLIRLEHARDALLLSLGLEEETSVEKWPFEVRALQAQIERRFEGLLAVVHRRFGEHRVASLIVDDPKQYWRIVRHE